MICFRYLAGLDCRFHGLPGQTRRAIRDKAFERFAAVAAGVRAEASNEKSWSRRWPLPTSATGGIRSRVSCSPLATRILMRLPAPLMVFTVLTAHATGPASAWCRSSMIAQFRQRALTYRRTPKTTASNCGARRIWQV